mmetsp:Transcript_1737/g.4064  ORF Transcript_1737/g.4064 Transcript_1737/m.4064 type:complete len:369 (-) Transcript_1737:31-1137(-)
MLSPKDKKWKSGGRLEIGGNDPQSLMLKISELLLDGETVTRALKRLRPRTVKAGSKRKTRTREPGDIRVASRKSPEADEPSVRESFDRLTDLAAELMSLGFEDIYVQTREQILESSGRGLGIVRGTSRYVWHDVEPPATDGGGEGDCSSAGGHKSHYGDGSLRYDAAAVKRSRSEADQSGSGQGGAEPGGRAEGPPAASAADRCQDAGSPEPSPGLADAGGGPWEEGNAPGAAEAPAEVRPTGPPPEAAAAPSTSAPAYHAAWQPHGHYHGYGQQPAHGYYSQWGYGWQQGQQPQWQWQPPGPYAQPDAWPHPQGYPQAPYGGQQPWGWQAAAPLPQDGTASWDPALPQGQLPAPPSVPPPPWGHGHV